MNEHCIHGNVPAYCRDCYAPPKLDGKPRPVKLSFPHGDESELPCGCDHVDVKCDAPDCPLHRSSTTTRHER